jgi:hypothetical protein
MALLTRFLRLTPLFVIALLTACGGGGGGGGGGGSSSSSGVKGFGAVAGPFGTKLAGLDQSVELLFSKEVDPTSVANSSIGLVTVADAAGLSSAPAGLQASVVFDVQGKRVFIRPLLEFNSQNVTFGFVADALYEITFGDPSVGNGILSVKGKSMSNAETSYFFRTPLDALDTKPGYPTVRAFFVDDTTGVVIDEVVDANSDADLVDETLLFFANPTEVVEGAALTVPYSPIRDLVFIFNDAVIPQTVFSSVDGSSPSIQVLLNTAGDGDYVPIIAPATLSFLHQQGDLTIAQWRSDLVALPPDAFLLVEVKASVEDLAGNSKLSLTGNFSPLISAPVNTESGIDPMAYLVTEPFDNTAQESITGSSAVWASPQGMLTTGLAGGLGLDGNLILDPTGTATAPGTTDVPLEALVDFDEKTVLLPTVEEVSPGVFEPRAWEFRRVNLPVGWTLAVLRDRDDDGMNDPDEFVIQSPGHSLNGVPAPIVVRATVDIDIAGSVLSRGVSGESSPVPANASDPLYADYLGQGGLGGQTLVSAGAGGDGGDVLLAVDTSADGLVDTILLDLVSPVVPMQGTAFDPADPRLRGATGRSASLSSSSLTDENTDLSILTDPSLGLGGDPDLYAQLLAGEIQLQPNMGLGTSDQLNAGTKNQFIDENHPVFVVEEVTVAGGVSSIEVVDSQGESMLEPSANIGTNYAPIAAAGDSYLLGRLQGLVGEDLAGFQRGGAGALPYVVVNDSPGITTTGGGGGGGGGLSEGEMGGSSGPASDPQEDQRGKGFGGVALDASPGGGGGLGAVRGTGAAVSDTEFDLLTQTSGSVLSGLDPTALVGSSLAPNAPNDGWLFEITDFNDPTFTVKRIESFGVDVGLTSGPGGFGGPGLSLDAEVTFLLVPPSGLGGSGGGGSGVSVTGTLNAGSSASTLPLLTPGAGGGSGGGSIELECAKFITVRGSATLSVRGGNGGEIDAPVALYAGGGGGSGGSLILRGGSGFKLFGGAVIEAQGGEGGSLEGLGLGGNGGVGWIRFENFLDTLLPSSFFGLTNPVLGAENVGRLVGLPHSVAESRFYNSGISNPELESLVVSYSADIDEDGVSETGLSWSYLESGQSGGAGDFLRPPFRFVFNPTKVDINGVLDIGGASPTFYEASDLVSGRAGFVFDATENALLYSIGESTSVIHDLTGSTDLALPDIPSVGGSQLDIVSMAVGGAVSELYLLERGAGLVHVFNRATGLFQRTISLPSVLEGAMVFVPGAMTEDDRLLIAANRSDLLVSIPTTDPLAGDPLTADFTVPHAENMFRIQRDAKALDFEFTGMAYDAATQTVWAVDPMARYGAGSSMLIQFSVADGSKGLSMNGVHGFARIVDGGVPSVASAVAFDGISLHILRSTDPDVTIRVAVDPVTVSLVGADLELPNSIVGLPEVARSIADGKTYLRFQLLVIGDAMDPDHESGPVTFGDVVIDEVELVTRNVSF